MITTNNVKWLSCIVGLKQASKTKCITLAMYMYVIKFLYKISTYVMIMLGF